MPDPVPGLDPTAYAAAATTRCPDCGGGWGRHSRTCTASQVVELADVVPIHPDLTDQQLPNLDTNIEPVAMEAQ